MLTLRKVTANAAPAGTAVAIFMLALVAGLLSLVPQRMAEKNKQRESTILSELYAHLLYLGASLSTTIVSTFLGNYSSALLTQVRLNPFRPASRANCSGSSTLWL